MDIKKVLLGIKFDEFASAIGLFIMLAITFGNVIGRYVLPVSWAFTEELDCALLVLVSLLGASAVLRHGGFLGLDLLVDILPKKYRKYIETLQIVSVLVFSVFLFYFGIIMVQSELRFGMKTAALGWPEAVFGSFIPIGAFFLFLSSIQQLVVIWAKDKDNSLKGENS